MIPHCCAVQIDIRWLTGEYHCSWRLAELAAVLQHCPI